MKSIAILLVLACCAFAEFSITVSPGGGLRNLQPSNTEECANAGNVSPTPTELSNTHSAMKIVPGQSQFTVTPNIINNRGGGNVYVILNGAGGNIGSWRVLGNETGALPAKTVTLPDTIQGGAGYIEVRFEGDDASFFYQCVDFTYTPPPAEPSAAALIAPSIAFVFLAIMKFFM